jgi:hypothetical protein
MSRKDLYNSDSQNDIHVLPKIKSVKFISSDFSKMMFSKEMGGIISELKIKNVETKKELDSINSRNERQQISSGINYRFRSPINHDSSSPFSGHHHKNNSYNILNFKKLGKSLKERNILSSTINPNNILPIKKDDINFLNKNHSGSFTTNKNSSLPNKMFIISNDFNFSIISSLQDENLIKNNINLNNHLKSHIHIHPKFYCPNCQHCNSYYMSDQPFEKHLNDLKEAHGIIKRGIEYFVDGTEEQKFVIDEIFLSDKDIKRDGFHLENFISEYTRHINSRTYYSQCTFFLQALIDGKIEFENFINSIKVDKIYSSPLFEGKTFKIKPDTTQFEIEKDFENLIDDKLKESLKNIFNNSGKINIYFFRFRK